MRLISIEVNNFKSFYGNHLIGPFTRFTSIVGPNGSGKSNILDAISFALCYHFPKGRLASFRKFIYRAKKQNESADEPQQMNVDNSSASDVKSMYVQLNFKNGEEQGISLKRSLEIRDNQDVFEFSINSRVFDQEEYVAELDKLNIGRQFESFIVFQDRLNETFFKAAQNQTGSTGQNDLERSSQAIRQIIEAVSGSASHEKEYLQKLEAKTAIEADIASLSQQLVAQRREKIMMKGLNSYKIKMNECFEKQKQTEQQLQILQCLLVGQQISQKEQSLLDRTKVIEQRFQQSEELNMIKQQEAQLRMLENNIRDKQQTQTTNKNRLQFLKENVDQSLKMADLSKMLLIKKKEILRSQQAQSKSMLDKKNAMEEEIIKAQAELVELEKQKMQSQKLREKAQVREKYLEIKSTVQAENVLIQRQAAKVEGQLEALTQRKNAAQKELKNVDQQIGDQMLLKNAQQDGKSFKQDIKAAQQNLQQIRNELGELKDEQHKKKEQLQKHEQYQLECEFELKEIEGEKNINAQDAQIQSVLKELKTRCRGYLGQFYELIKPIAPKYDIAIKVAFKRCLKFLVVQNKEAAEICNDFLKEKQISRDLLVLQNVPTEPKKHNPNSLQTLMRGTAGEMIYTVTELSYRDQLLDQAVRYFASDKVVCDSFEEGVALQKKGVKDLVTTDGTEMKKGMISGGNHKNIFNLNLGTSTRNLDKQITKLIKDIDELSQYNEKLQSELDQLQKHEVSKQKDIGKAEIELESIKMKQAKQVELESTCSETVKKLKDQRKVTQVHFDTINKQFSDLNKQKNELRDELNEVETDAFKDFCQQNQYANIRDYEKQLYGEDGSEEHIFFTIKINLEQLIASNQAKVQSLDTSDTQKNLQALQKSVEDEEKKFQDLQKGAESSEETQKLEVIVREAKTDLENLLKQKDQLQNEQKKNKTKHQENKSKQESLEKENILDKIHIKGFENQLDQLLDSAKINKVLDFEINQTAPVSEKNTLLREKFKQTTEIRDSEIESHEQIKQLESHYKKQMNSLIQEEEQFNQCVSVIPETDEKAIELTQAIERTKKDLDTHNAKHKEANLQLTDVKQTRTQKFMDLFNPVKQALPKIYKELTQKDNQTGKAHIAIVDETKPFESIVQFEFCPPMKQHGYQLSGGEKTIASLAFLFALAKIQGPNLFFLDEIDAFLDATNVNLVSDYVKNQLKQDAQVGIISHKSDLAQHSDSLIGVSHIQSQQQLPNQNSSSQTYSLNLQNL